MDIEPKVCLNRKCAQHGSAVITDADKCAVCGVHFGVVPKSFPWLAVSVGILVILAVGAGAGWYFLIRPAALQVTGPAVSKEGAPKGQPESAQNPVAAQPPEKPAESPLKPAVAADTTAQSRALCLEAQGYSAKVVLIDGTDPLNRLQIEALTAFIEELKLGLGEKELLMVQLFDARAVPQTIARYAGCRLATAGADKSTPGGTFVEDRGMGANFSAALYSLESVPSERRSPVFSALARLPVAARAAGTPLQSVYVVSDMLHEDESYSLKRTKGTLPEFQKTKTFLEAKPDLKGVLVEMSMLARCGWTRAQGQSLIDFWANVIASVGGKPVFRTLAGLGDVIEQSKKCPVPKPDSAEKPRAPTAIAPSPPEARPPAREIKLGDDVQIGPAK